MNNNNKNVYSHIKRKTITNKNCKNIQQTTTKTVTKMKIE